MWAIIDKEDCCDYVTDGNFKLLKFKTEQEAARYILEELELDTDDEGNVINYEIVKFNAPSRKKKD